MKKIILSLIALISFSAVANAETKYNLYYFHNNTRCGNCIAFEEMSKKLAPSLPVNFKIINTQNEGNEHYINDYKLYTKSIVITDDKGNYKNLDKIWNYVRDEKKFNQYIEDEVLLFRDKYK